MMPVREERESVGVSVSLFVAQWFVLFFFLCRLPAHPSHSVASFLQYVSLASLAHPNYNSIVDRRILGRKEGRKKKMSVVLGVVLFSRGGSSFLSLYFCFL